MRERIHDRELLDALEQIEPISFEDKAWRVVREGREPIHTLPTGAGGRWDDGQFEVLYASLDRGTAVSEVYYHLSKQPVFPSSIVFYVYQLEVSTSRILQFLDVESLTQFGIQLLLYSSSDYKRVKSEIYPISQAIGAAAHFLEYDGLIVPSARKEAQNLVIFLDRVRSVSVSSLVAPEKVDWRRTDL